MAENETAGVQPKTTKQTTAKTTRVTGTVVIETMTFDPLQPVLVDRAAEVFKAQMAETYGGRPLSNVQVSLAKHQVGKSASYNVTGEIAG